MLNKLLIILIFYACVVSCAKEITISNATDDEVTYTEGNVSVYLENPETTTRSGWEYDDYFSSSDIRHADNKKERGRFNACIISFNSDFKLEYYGDQITSRYFEPPATDIQSSEEEYTAFPLGTGNVLTTGAHYFYVVSNIPKKMFDDIFYWFNEAKGVLTKDDFESYVIHYPIDTLVRKFEGWDTPDKLHSSQRCMMTNIVSPSPDYMASKEQNSTGYYPSSNNVVSHIGKVFAKASLAYIPQDNHDRLEDVQYRVVNLPNSIYFMPNIFNGNVETPHYERNYQESEFGGDFDAYYQKYFDETYKLPETDDQKWVKATISKDETNKSHVYCMENSNKIPLQGNSTFLLVKAKYNPEKWLDKDGNPGSATMDGTFWRIKRAGHYATGYYNEKPDRTEIGSGEVIEYKQGLTYYPIWLQTNGNYEVRRNGFYKIALTQVLSAGAPSLDSVIDPVSPLEDIMDQNSFTRSGNTQFSDITQSIVWQQGGI